jgi:two-component system chemotaxis response regulator CheB
VIVGSHGGLEAAKVLLGCLPEGFPATVVVDLHRNNALGGTPRVLARHMSLPLQVASDGLVHQRGTVYLAPHDCSVLLSDRQFVGVLGTASPCRWHRFADILLSGAAQCFGSRLIAIILSGHLDGGALGARAVKTHGGTVLVQAPATAPAPAMPRAALSTGCVDFALPPSLLGSAVVELCAAAGAADLFRVDAPFVSQTN